MKIRSDMVWLHLPYVKKKNNKEKVKDEKDEKLTDVWIFRFTSNVECGDVSFSSH